MKYSTKPIPGNHFTDVRNHFISLIIIFVFCTGITSAQSASVLKNSSVGLSVGSAFIGDTELYYGGRYALWLSPYHYVGMEYSNIKLLNKYHDYPSGYTIDIYHVLYGVVLRNKTFVSPFAEFSIGKSRELTEDPDQDTFNEILPTTYSIRYGILFNIYRFNLALELGGGNISTLHMGMNMVLSYNINGTPKTDPYDYFTLYAGLVHAVSWSSSSTLNKYSGLNKEYVFEVEKNRKVFEFFMTQNKMKIDTELNVADDFLPAINIGLGRVIPVLKIPYVQLSGIMGVQFKHITFIVSPGIYGGLSLQTKIWRIRPSIRYRYMYNQHFKNDYVNLDFYTQSLSFNIGYEL